MAAPITPPTGLAVGPGSSTNPALLIPKRNPGLIERIAGLIFRAQPNVGPQPSQQQTTQSGITVQALQSVYDQYFKSLADRQATYKDVDEMDEVSEEISVALDTIADNVVTSEDGVQMSFAVSSDDPKIDALLNQVTQTTKLYTRVYSIARNLIKYGDNFAEIVVNAQGEVVELRQLPPSTMFRNQDNRGDLVLGKPEYDPNSGSCLNKGGECAFEQRAEDTQEIVAAFWPWQIVHYRNNHDGFKPYGRSHLRVARIIWKKLKAIEEAMIIARLVRAYPKLRAKIDTTGLSPMEADATLTKISQALNQRQGIDGRREQPYSILSDIYLGVPKVKDSTGRFVENATTVDLLEPTGMTVFNIQDVKDYFHRKLLCCLRIPPAHLGWEEQVNSRALISRQDVQYMRLLRRIQQLIGHGLEQFYDTTLVLHGFDPNTAEYTIAWPRLSADDDAAAADAEFARAQADNLYAQMKAIDAEWIQEHRFDMSPEEMEEIKERMDEVNREAAKAAQAAEGIDPDNPQGTEDQGAESDDSDQSDNSDEPVSQEGMDSDDPALLQYWTQAARDAATIARKGKAHARIAAGIQSKHHGSKGIHPYHSHPHVSPITHTHAHGHGANFHSHAHSHAAGSSSHAHSHSAGTMSGGVMVGEEELGFTQYHNSGTGTVVALLTEALKSRTNSLLSRELDRAIERQGRNLSKAMDFNDEDAAS
jgi:Bacteriophage T4-like portal protein (Gp20)